MTFPNLKCTEKRKTALGRFLYGIGWSAMLSFFMFFLIMIIMDGKLENEWLLFLLMFIPFLSAFLLQYGKRLAAEDTVSTLSKDKRPIVLILRAFTVDRNAFWDGAGSELNFEQNLANILSCAGPVVAVGRPGEKLALVGLCDYTSQMKTGKIKCVN